MKKRPDTTWRLLVPHVRPHVGAFALVFGLGLITATAQALSLGLFAGVWRVIFPEGSKLAGEAPATVGKEDPLDVVLNWLERAARASTLTDDWRLSLLAWLSLIAFGLALAAALAQWGYTLISRHVAFQMIVDLRVRVARHLLGLSLHYHGQRKFGDVLSRVSSDVTSALAAVNVVMRSLIIEPLKAMTVLAVMLATAPGVTFGVLIGLPLALWPVAKLTRRVRKRSKRSMTSLGSSVQALTQMFQGVRTVKSFGGEERELERYRELNESYLSTSMRMVRAIALTHSWTAFYSIAGIGLLMFAIGWLQLRFQPFEDGEKLAAWFLMVARLSNHVKSTTRAFTKYGEANGASERILELLEEEVDVREAADPVPLRSFDGEIRFEGVTFAYAKSVKPALEDLNLVIHPGETLALVGPSGAGKSTLVDLVARFIDPTEGRISVCGRDLREYARADWTALYAMVGQVPFLFHSSIGENIAYGRADATQAEVEDAARAADIHDFIVALPNGYDTDVADMGTRLSGGQRQRITIARAILKGAPLLLLDEATSALDSESESEVQAALERLMENRTVIVIAHRLSTVRNANRIVVLDQGRMVEVGSHEELVGMDGVYSRLHALQNLESPPVASSTSKSSS